MTKIFGKTLEGVDLTPEKLLGIPYGNGEKITQETSRLVEYTKDNCFTCLQGEKKSLVIEEVVCGDWRQPNFHGKAKNASDKCDLYMPI